jgi:hypothetical protein
LVIYSSLSKNIMSFLLRATKLRFCPYSQGGDFTVLLKGELRGINSKAVYARKGKYYLDEGQVLGTIPAKEAAFQYHIVGVKVI